MRWSNFAIWTFVRWEWIERPTPCSSGTCSTNWATTAFYLGRMMGVEPMTKGATILYSTNWATISIFRGRGGIRTYWVSNVLVLQTSAHPPSEQPSHYFVWMTRLERAPAITACSGSQNRRGLPTPPHPDYIFPNLSMNLKIKRASSLLRKLFISYIV